MFYENLTLLTDLYQLTMMQGYFETNRTKKQAVFDMFYRTNPHGNGYAIAAGLEQVIKYVQNISFSKDDIDYLKNLRCFTGGFLNYLESFKFTGEIYAVKEGSVVFPHEPLIRVKAPIMEAQFIETAVLTIINHQSLIATKAARVAHACQNDTLMEFGLRRAQGPDAGIYGARAAMIGGCHGTSNVIVGKMFGAPVMGTHAHSWIMSFDDEITAFREYAKLFPEKCILLVDTYDTLKSGTPNAIRVFDEMKAAGVSVDNVGIRLDSGDLAYLSKEAYKMLDEAGYGHAKICASSDLDEELISDLKRQGAMINTWGVGTNLITSKGCPSFGGVYKLAAEIDAAGAIHPKIKLSENIEKVTNPGLKKVYRLYDRRTGKMKADLIALEDETLDTRKDLTIFDPNATWKKTTLRANEYHYSELLVPIFINGECVYGSPALMDIRERCKNELETLWEEHKRLVNPQIMYVDLSEKLYNLKESMIREIKGD